MSKKCFIKNKIAYILACILCVSCVLGGCGWTEPSDKEQDDMADVQVGTMESIPRLEYKVPQMLPGVLVDQIGYEASGTKIFIVRGKELPKEFSIIHAETGETVFTGKLEQQVYDKISGEYIAYGDFTTYTKEGNYYVECDVIGQSYLFDIENTLYEKFMSETLKKLTVVKKDLVLADITDVCEGISVLLLSYELFANVYDNQSATGAEPQLISMIKEYIIWLLAAQDSQTGAILSNGQIDKEQTAWFAAVLAKFSYTYQRFDSTYATMCLQASDRAWKSLQKEKDIPAEAMFYAAAELYRATGQFAYHKQVKALGAETALDVENEAQVFGALTYAFTKRNVDVDICAGMMQELFAEAEDIAVRTNENMYMSGSSLEHGEENILWDMVLLSTIDYVITNQEYATMIEDHLHYLAGANEGAECRIWWSEQYTGEKTEETCVSSLAGYVMMLSEILSHRQEE